MVILAPQSTLPATVPHCLQETSFCCTALGQLWEHQGTQRHGADVASHNGHFIPKKVVASSCCSCPAFASWGTMRQDRGGAPGSTWVRCTRGKGRTGPLEVQEKKKLEKQCFKCLFGDMKCLSILQMEICISLIYFLNVLGTLGWKWQKHSSEEVKHPKRISPN